MCENWQFLAVALWLYQKSDQLTQEPTCTKNAFVSSLGLPACIKFAFIADNYCFYDELTVLLQKAGQPTQKDFFEKQS